jgi:hypothetical protein
MLGGQFNACAAASLHRHARVRGIAAWYVVKFRMQFQTGNFACHSRKENEIFLDEGALSHLKLKSTDEAVCEALHL